ncbi:MAG TPA: hypothetical protein VG826_13505 [Pirellulales bacterium]|nr:hypothetical protein [Pirellulales bacterium]
MDENPYRAPSEPASGASDRQTSGAPPLVKVVLLAIAIPSVLAVAWVAVGGFVAWFLPWLLKSGSP